MGTQQFYYYDNGSWDEWNDEVTAFIEENSTVSSPEIVRYY